MTAQKAQIESLIQEIDEVLSKTAPRLPWIMSEEAAHQREVLEQTRRYLLSIQTHPPQESQPALPPAPAPIPSEIPAANIPHPTPPSQASPVPQLPSPPAPHSPTPHSPLPTPQLSQPAVESAQQALQAIVQEMNYLRSNLLQPMRSDVDSLRRQREMLLQEVRQLEAQRQQYALPQQNQLLMEFLQAAFRQMQDNLTAQVSQMMATLGTQASQAALPEGVAHSSGSDLSGTNLSGTDLSGTNLSALSPAQRLEQIQRVQTQSDELLLKLDSSLRIIFNSLQQNVQTYEDSLEQGLSRMHNLGQQGEAMFSALVTRLAEQLGREASTFLQSSIEPANWEPVLPPETRSPQPAPVQPTPVQPSPVQPPETDTDISRLLSELNELDTAQPPQRINPFAADAQKPENVRLNADLNSMDLLDLELKEIDLDAITPEPFSIVDEDLTVFQDDPISGIFGADLTTLQDTSEPEVVGSSEAEFGQAERAIDSFTDPFAEQNSDFAGANDAAEVMDLLNQIEVDLTADLATPASTNLSADTALRDPGSEILSGNAAIDPFAQVGETAEPALVDSPDSLYDDAFYQTLFGETAAPSITAEDLFAEGLTAETVEPPIAEAADPEDGTLTDIPLGRKTQDDLFSTFPEAELSSEELTIVEAPDLAQSVENVLLPPIDLQPALPTRMPPAAQPADEIHDRPVIEPAVELAVEPAAAEPSELEQFSESFPDSFSSPSPFPYSPDFPEPSSKVSSEVSPEASSEIFPESSSETIETIGSLIDLIPFGSSSGSSFEQNDRAGDLISNPSSDSVNLTIAPTTLAEPEFELAQPGEDLLADEPSHPDGLLNLRLPMETLEQLAQDLSGLEGEDTQMHSQFALADTTDWRIADTFSEPPPNAFDQPLQFSDSPESPPQVFSGREDSGAANSDAGDAGDAETAEKLADWFASEPPASTPPTADSLEFVVEPIGFDSSAPLQSASPRLASSSEEQPTGWDLFNEFADQSEAQPPASEEFFEIGATPATSEQIPNSAPDRASDSASDGASDGASDTAFTLNGLDALFASLPPRQPQASTAETSLFLDDLDQFGDPAGQPENRSQSNPAESEDEKKKA